MSRDLIIVYKGLKALMPVLAVGEFGLTTDPGVPGELYIGTAEGNQLVSVDQVNVNDLNVLRKIYPITTVGSAMTATTDGDFDYTVGKWVFLKADTNIVAPATLSIDGGAVLVAKDTNGNDIDISANTVYLCSLENNGADFFQLAPKGGTVSTAQSSGAYVKYEGFSVVDTVGGNLTYAWGGIASDNKAGQTFLTPGGGNLRLSKVIVPMAKLNSPSDDVFLEIYATSGGLPIGSPIDVSDAIPASLIGLSKADFTFNFNNLLLSAGTTYAIVANRTGALNDNDRYVLYRETSDVYPSGTIVTFTNPTWSAIGTQDMDFRLFFGEEQSVLKIDGANAVVETGDFIMANEAVFIDDGGSGQTIVAIESAPNETAIQATVTGTLKTDTSYTTARQVYVAIFKNSQGFTPV